MTTENYENIHNFRQIEVGSFFYKIIMFYWKKIRFKLPYVRWKVWIDKTKTTTHSNFLKIIYIFLYSYFVPQPS